MHQCIIVQSLPDANITYQLLSHFIVTKLSHINISKELFRNNKFENFKIGQIIRVKESTAIQIFTFSAGYPQVYSMKNSRAVLRGDVRV